MNKNIQDYHNKQAYEDKLICDQLYEIIGRNLPQGESKVLHAHSVWFLETAPLSGAAS